MTASLRVEGLTVRHPGRGDPPSAVDDVSFELEAAQIGCLLGPSGCGKTSLLRAIAGFVIPAAGTVMLGDVRLSGPGVSLPPEQRRIGFMFQEYALFPHLTAHQNVAFGLRRVPREARLQRTAAMLALVGLADAGERHPHELSGGQQQRIALARALAPAPALLLLDEPFSNLDDTTRAQLSREVLAILKAARQTAMLVTHHESDAEVMADRVGRMARGRLDRWSPVSRPHLAAAAAAPR